MDEQHLRQLVTASKIANSFRRLLTEEGIEMGEGACCDAIYTYSDEESDTVSRLFREAIIDAND